jgi:CheY-like chemotaxis protein
MVEAQMNTEQTSSRRILVVDDDEVMRELVEALLGIAGHEVLLAASGQEALGLLQTQSPPDLVVTDLQMPGLEGEALVKALRATAPPATALLGMSGNQPSRAVLEVLDAFVAKPFGPEQLESALLAAHAAHRSKSHAVDAVLKGSEAAGQKASEGAPAVLDEGIYAAMARRFHPEQLHELYTLTLDDVAQRHQRMEQHADAGDLPAVQREAHAIKGSCGMVGARELQHLASAVEGGTTLNTSALAEIPAAGDRLRRMLDAKLQQ